MLNVSYGTSSFDDLVIQKKDASIQLSQYLTNLRNVNEDYIAIRNQKLSTALTLNSTIIPQTTYEGYEKSVNNILLNLILTQERVLTDAQIGELIDIAVLCSDIGGKAVYSARALLPECVVDNLDICGIELIPDEYEVQSGLLGSQDPTISQNQSSNLIYPNPTSSEFTVLLDGKQSGQIHIKDLSGKIMKVVSFSDEDFRKVIKSNFYQGIYLLSITWDNGESHTEKLLIQQ